MENVGYIQKFVGQYLTVARLWLKFYSLNLKNCSNFEYLLSSIVEKVPSPNQRALLNLFSDSSPSSIQEPWLGSPLKSIFVNRYLSAGQRMEIVCPGNYC